MFHAPLFRSPTMLLTPRISPKGTPSAAQTCAAAEPSIDSMARSKRSCSPSEVSNSAVTVSEVPKRAGGTCNGAASASVMRASVGISL